MPHSPVRPPAERDAPTPRSASGLDARPCAIPGVVAFAPRQFRDARGGFAELHQAARYAAHGVPEAFVQDNVAWSAEGVLRGLHLQHPHGQGKLVTVLHGAIFDVAADVRVGSPTFGRCVALTLEAGGVSQLWVPQGFAHGYLAVEGEPLVTYKCTDVYRPDCELTIRWDDPALDVPWPAAPRVLSDKDRAGLLLADAIARGVLPRYDAAAGVVAELAGVPAAGRVG